MESLLRGKRIEYEPPRFLDCATAAKQMIEIEETRKEGICGPETLVVAVARVGHSDQRIKTTTLGELASIDMGPPLHSLVLPGTLHDLESEMIKHFS